MTITTDRLIHQDPVTEDRYRSSNRAFDQKWLLLEEPAEMHGKPATRKVWVTLTCQHYGRREMYNEPEFCFRATLRRDDYVEGDGFTVQEIRVGDPILLLGEEDCQRFSRKRLDTFAAAMLVELRNRRDEPNIRAWFGEADG